MRNCLRKGSRLVLSLMLHSYVGIFGCWQSETLVATESFETKIRNECSQFLNLFALRLELPYLFETISKMTISYAVMLDALAIVILYSFHKFCLDALFLFFSAGTYCKQHNQVVCYTYIISNSLIIECTENIKKHYHISSTSTS